MRAFGKVPCCKQAGRVWPHCIERSSMDKVSMHLPRLATTCESGFFFPLIALWYRVMLVAVRGWVVLAGHGGVMYAGLRRGRLSDARPVCEDGV